MTEGAILKVRAIRATFWGKTTFAIGRAAQQLIALVIRNALMANASAATPDTIWGMMEGAIRTADATPDISWEKITCAIGRAAQQHIALVIRNALMANASAATPDTIWGMTEGAILKVRAIRATFWGKTTFAIGRAAQQLIAPEAPFVSTGNALAAIMAILERMAGAMRIRLEWPLLLARPRRKGLQILAFGAR